MYVYIIYIVDFIKVGESKWKETKIILSWSQKEKKQMFESDFSDKSCSQLFVLKYFVFFFLVQQNSFHRNLKKMKQNRQKQNTRICAILFLCSQTTTTTRNMIGHMFLSYFSPSTVLASDGNINRSVLLAVRFGFTKHEMYRNSWLFDQ